MKGFCILSIVAVAALFTALAQNPNSPFNGRWDMTLTIGNNHFPSWLEVTDKNGTMKRECSRAQVTSPCSGP